MISMGIGLGITNKILQKSDGGQPAQPTVPAAVSNLVLSSPTTTGGTLTWTLPNNGGSAITSQRIERSPAGANTWSILNNAIAANATSFTDTTAAANTAYDYRHRSTNAIGNSAYSNVVTITTPASNTVPAAVNNLALATPTTTGGTLTWTLPNNGGSALTSQRIERSPAGANTWSILNNAIAANATSFTDTTAAANTAYDYRHRSTNAVGNSAYSNVVTITTAQTLDLLMEYDLLNSSNYDTTQFSKTFNSANVDVNGRIALDWSAEIGATLDRAHTNVYFETTGTLPAPLQLNTPYALRWNTSAGAMEIYPVLAKGQVIQNNDIPYVGAGEVLYPSELFRRQAGRIVLTNGGSGTHTCRTNTLVSAWRSNSGALGTFQPGVTNDFNSYLELKQDGDGLNYIELAGSMSKNPSSGRGDLQGKRYEWVEGNLLRTSMAQYFCEKRFAYQLIVIEPDSHAQFEHARILLAPSAFNTSTGVITRSSHSFVTGDTAYVAAFNGALPAGLVANTRYFVRSLSTSTLGLYPTATDAANNTNIIIPTNQGSGDIMIWNNEDLRSGGNDIAVTIDMPDADQHYLKMSIAKDNQITLPRIGSTVQFTWSTSSGVRGVLPSGFPSNVVVPVRLRTGFGSTPPTGFDTTQTYYAVQLPGSNSSQRARLFNTEQNALNHIASGHTNMTGQVIPANDHIGNPVWQYVDGFTPTDTSMNVPIIRPVRNRRFIYCLIRDVNTDNPAITHRNVFISGINAANNLATEQIGNGLEPKGLIPLANARTNQQWLLGTPAEPHRAFGGKMLYKAIGASNNNPVNALNAKIQSLITQYNITV